MLLYFVGENYTPMLLLKSHLQERLACMLNIETDNVVVTVILILGIAKTKKEKTNLTSILVIFLALLSLSLSI